VAGQPHPGSRGSRGSRNSRLGVAAQVDSSDGKVGKLFIFLTSASSAEIRRGQAGDNKVSTCTAIPRLPPWLARALRRHAPPGDAPGVMAASPEWATGLRIWEGEAKDELYTPAVFDTPLHVNLLAMGGPTRGGPRTRR
jgi:hypothetical protein